jgi:hydroxyacylglutathione hydrolase
MKVEQLYTGCLAEAAYYIESDGEAAIIDPLRETKQYLKMAEERGVKIKYIFETHFHADFVSGHLDLAKSSGAIIVFGPLAETAYQIHEAKDEEEFAIGKLTIRVLHTPGHTQESSTYLLLDEHGKEQAIFTGDTLFIGDVGRPDLAIRSDLTQEDLAGMLFDSLRTKIMPLPDHVMVYPAHGAGSACGKNMSKETYDTLGHQKKVNYALNTELTKASFIKELTTGILPPPQYFAKNAMMNKTGYDALDDVMKRGNVALDVETFESIATHQGALVLDTRSPAAFTEAHIPNSIFIGIDGSFAPWVGALILDLKQPIVFIADKGREEEVVTRLSRVGYDNTLGFLDGGVEAWSAAGKATEAIRSISAERFEEEMNAQERRVLDVRKPSEFEAEHLSAAQNFPLDFINEHMHELDQQEQYYIHCAGGYRSVIASSILKSRGYHDLIDVKGGFKAISSTSLTRTTFNCPTTNT